MMLAASPAPVFCSQCTHSAPSGVAAMCGVSAQSASSEWPTAIVRGALCQRPSPPNAANCSALRRPGTLLIQLSSSVPSAAVATRSGWAAPGWVGNAHACGTPAAATGAGACSRAQAASSRPATRTA